MQMCPFCDMVYDESEYAKCPYCTGELEIDTSERPYKDCPSCGSVMYWDEIWVCSNCLYEIEADEDDADGIIEG